MRRLYFLLLAVISLSVSAQDFSKQKLDSLFLLIDSNNKGMGAISIFENDREVYSNAIGYADLDRNKTIIHSTKFRIGSISKTFTAAIIMQMRDEGKLDLETKLEKFYPRITNSDEIDIEQLLRHRSGLQNFTSKAGYEEWMENPKTRQELLDIFVSNGTVFKPGEKSEYSNTNYVLLSFIAEDIEQKSFEEILKDRITDPLQLENTGYGQEINSNNNEAFSYTFDTSWVLATETDMSIPLGAGGIISTPFDLNSFMTALHEGKVVSAESLEIMKHMKEGFGIGMFITPFYEYTGYGHTGGIDGFHAVSSYFPDKNVAVAWCSNAEEMPMNDILIGALSIYFNKEYELPSFKKYEISGEELDQYTGTYSSSNFPLKVYISKEGTHLTGQATGQPSFPLEAYDKNKFKFDQAGLRLEFIPQEGKMLLKQAGQVFELSRE